MEKGTSLNEIEYYKIVYKSIAIRGVISNVQIVLKKSQNSTKSVAFHEYQGETMVEHYGYL